jgi:hypothetical protein
VRPLFLAIFHLLEFKRDTDRIDVGIQSKLRKGHERRIKGKENSGIPRTVSILGG